MIARRRSSVRRFTYGSVCSGIEAASVAWEPLGWGPSFFAEIDAFPSAVLAQRFPGVPNLGDFTKIGADDVEPVDLLVAGTPCQDFSVAGKRLGIRAPRGNLALEFLALAARLRPPWIVFENVPGLLSSWSGAEEGPAEAGAEWEGDENNDFAAFLGAVRECGYLGCWRVLDAQYAGLAQRRERVFFVGYLGDWRPPAAVLFESLGVLGDTPPCREAGKGVAPTIAACTKGGGGLGTDFDCDGGLIAFGGNDTRGPIEIATAVNAHGGTHGRLDFESETFITHALRADGFDGSEDGTGRGTLLIAFSSKDHGADAMSDLSPTLRAGGHDKSHANAGAMPAVAFAENSRAELRLEGGDGAVAGSLKVGGGKPGQGYPCVAFQTCIARNGRGQPEEIVPSLNGADAGATSDMRPCVADRWGVRRLTPRECERLQGFPDDFTLIKYRGKLASDGPRYKALGNSMAVPVMRGIGERIALVDGMIRKS